MIFEDKEKFYYCSILHLIANDKNFQLKASCTCPTIWGDGTKCTEVEDILNKASMEIDWLIDFDLI